MKGAQMMIGACSSRLDLMYLHLMYTAQIEYASIAIMGHRLSQGAYREFQGSVRPVPSPSCASRWRSTSGGSQHALLADLPVDVRLTDEATATPAGR